MTKLKEFLCFLIFAGHDERPIHLWVDCAKVKCRRCGRERLV